MNFRDLAYFHQLNQVLSFTQVAKNFSVSQPTITQSVKRLERYFNTELLIRNPHTNGVQLTPAGRQLSQTAEEILTVWERNRAVIARMTADSLLIGIEPTIGEQYLLKIVSALQANGLFQHVRFVEAGSLVLDQKLAVGEVDAIITGEVEREENPVEDRLVPIHFQLLASVNHPLVRQRSVTVKDTLGFPIVTKSANFLNHKIFARLYARQEPQVLFESDNAHVVLDAVASNVALGFLADLIKLPDTVVPLHISDAQLPHVWLTLRYRSDRQPTHLANQIMDVIKKAVRGND